MLTQRFEDALIYARKVHGEQMRKDTDIPHISHLMSVASLVMEHGGDEDQVIAALLHDAIEDQSGEERRDEIRELFGERVCTLVEACTDAYTHPKPPWRERKEAFIERVEEMGEEVLLIVLADKLHNARTILADYALHGDKVWKRFRGKKEGTLWYYRTLADVLSKRHDSMIVAELNRTVTEIEAMVSVEL